MGRGSVLFYDGKVLHGAGANTSDGVRRGVNITYAVGWVRQEENQYLACPPEIARTLDDDLLRMMGYTQGAFALGYVGDQTDPLAALRGGTAKAKTIGASGRAQRRRPPLRQPTSPTPRAPNRHSRRIGSTWTAPASPDPAEHDGAAGR